MRTKKIRIKSRIDLDAGFLKSARKIDRGEKIKEHRGEYFESLDAVRNVLNPRRRGLRHIIRDF